VIIIKYKALLIEYFAFFSNKDVNSLKSIFSDSIILKDWDLNISGKKNVLEANRKIFESVKTISATPLYFYSNSDYSYAVQIALSINKESELRIIDVINFDYNGKITEINAFKIY